MSSGWLYDGPPIVNEPPPVESVVPAVALLSRRSTGMASATPASTPPAVLGEDLAAIVAVGRLSPDVDEETCVSGACAMESSTPADEARSIDPGASSPSELLAEGNEAFREHKFEDAIEVYSRALLSHPPNSVLLLSNRCASFCYLSKKLRQIPAAQSEARALYGLDPTSLAQLALRDADKALKLAPDWPKAHYRRGASLLMLEQYEAAREAFLGGLSIDPTSPLLLQGLKELEEEEEEEEEDSENRVSNTAVNVVGNSSKRRRAALELSDEFDCSLCLKLLYLPVTTPCGHTFCRGCLVRSLDHGNKCPVCRTVLFVTAKIYPISVTLQTILERHFPAEYLERKMEAEALPEAGREVLPLFVMESVFPGQKMALNIFEPRYRLMVRRCMEGDHRMGMVGIDTETRLPADVACEVIISECESLPDGRFYLEVEGRRRCKIVESWEQDGYRVAHVDWVQDAELLPDSLEASSVAELASAAAELARTWMSCVQEGMRASRRMQLNEVVRQAGEMPPATQAEKLSFWLANLLIIRTDERLAVMRSTNTRERLERETELLRAPSSQSCRMQ